MGRLRTYIQDPATGTWHRPEYGDAPDIDEPPPHGTITLINRTRADWSTGEKIYQYLLKHKTYRRYIRKLIIANSPPHKPRTYLTHIDHPLLTMPIVLQPKDTDETFCERIKIHLRIEQGDME